MQLGTSGSPLTAELNRLANNGVYPAMTSFLDSQGAANAWAGTTGLATVGALNYIADPLRTKDEYKDIDGICNELAGTTGLDASDALATILHPAEVILDPRLGNAPAFYTDAATPRYNYPGYIYLPGIAGQYISVPDSAALDITGDIDLRIQVAMDDWTPSSTQVFIAKETTGSTRSFRFYIASDGKLYLLWSTDGSATTFAASSVVTGITDGTTKWIRATLSVASNYKVKFFTSDNGTTWIQLGTDVDGVGATSIFSSTSDVSIGTRLLAGGEAVAGKLYRAQVLDGIDGTTVLDADLTTNVTSATYDQFTATTGQLCTINGQNTLTNAGNAGALLPTTVGSSLAADSNDAKFLAHDGTNYVYLSGVGGNHLSVPDAAALDITGDIDVRAYISLDDWTPATEHSLVTKFSSPGSRSYRFSLVGTSGALSLSWTTDGTTLIQTFSTVAPVIADGAPLWVRATLDVDNGASGKTVIYYTSTDGITWTQLGATVTSAGTTSIFASTAPVEIGSDGLGYSRRLTGKIYRAQILDGIDGTTVLDVDTSVITSGADTYVVPTTYTGQAGAFFTGSGLSLNGVASNYASAPDSAALDITGDIDLRVKVAMDDWTPGVQVAFVSKFTSAGNQRSYKFALNPSGFLAFDWSADGTNGVVNGLISTAATGITDGATKWVRVTLDVDNGASGNSVQFFTSDDGSTWTQLGSTVTTAGVTSIYSGTAAVEVGSRNAGTAENASGEFYRAQVLSGIDGYPVFDANFETVSANALRMTESSINQAVVTLNTTRYAKINRSTSGRKTVAVTQPTWLFGTDDYMEVNNRYMAHSTSDENYVYLSGASGNYMSVADNPPLDVTGDIDIRVKVALDGWATGAGQYLVAKSATAGQASYRFFVASTGALAFGWSANGTAYVTTIYSGATISSSVAAGATIWLRATLDVDNGAGGSDVKFFTSTDGIVWSQFDVTQTTAGTTSIFAGTSILEIGSINSGGNAKGKIFRAIIKDGIDGTTVLDANAAVITLPSQTTFVDSSSNAYTVTINKSGVGTFVSTGNYLYLPGVASNFASTPDSAALDITGDIDLRLKLALDDWTPSALKYLFSKYQGSANVSYALSLTTAGLLQLSWSVAGTTIITKASTVATGIIDGTVKWVRATLDVDNGASGNDVAFYTSDDGSTWTQLGTTVTTAGTTSIYAGTSKLEIGSVLNGAGNLASGKFFRAQFCNGIGGTVAFDANFEESSITSLLQTTFTESSSNAATVTINRSGSTYRSAGVIDAGYLYPGATNTFSNSTIDYLNFGASEPMTMLFVGRLWSTQNAYRYMMGKGSTYAFGNDGTNLSTRSVISGTQINLSFLATSGGLLTLGNLINRSNSTSVFYVNGNVNGTIPSFTGALSTINTLLFGTNDKSTYQDFEFYGAAVFRQVLTATQISRLNDYFQNRY
jgi:uncharacterized protein YneR